jgi:hypothetical protein
MARKQYLFTITHFDSDADRVATPLVLANNALAAGGGRIGAAENRQTFSF